MSAGSEENTGPRDDASTWHRIFAASSFNQAWDLIEKPDRTPEDNSAMLSATFASRYHWEVVGTDENRVVGDWQIAHIASLLGMADLSLSYAKSALNRAVEKGFEGWRLASCHEGMARAHACSGNVQERNRHIKTAKILLDRVDDPGERNLVMSQLESVPGYSQAVGEED
jgi:hypothetical protein